MGDIQLPGFGDASAVLYDGSSYQPYILSSKADGSNGILYTLFSQNIQSFSSNGIPLR
jgi:Cortical protein marker for cell polarity